MGEKRKYTARTFFNDLHLWLGLLSGIIIFLVCLSGTLLTYEEEIEALFSDKIKITAAGNAQNIEKLIAHVETETKGKVTSVFIPSDKSEPQEYIVTLNPEERRGTKVLVNPYNSQFVVPKKTFADDFMFVMFRLHRWLLFNSNIGRPIVGVATIIFLILSVTGIILWFPRKIKWKYLKQGFKIKTRANWKRINHDLHNTLGFYSCLLILIMGLTGLCWSFEDYRNLLSSALGAKVFGERGKQEQLPSLSTKNDKEISYVQAIALANKHLNYSGDLRVVLPNSRNKNYTISKLNDKKWTTIGFDVVTIDTYGRVLKSKFYEDIPLNEKIASAIKPLHTGTIFGGISKLLYFFACLIATSLPVTGTIIWYHKLKKNKKWYLS